MFDPTSRYHRVETATLIVTEPDGTTRQVVYKRRRLITPGADSVTMVEHTVAEGERLDQITARYFGDPTQFHLLCDENGALHPEELTAEVGRVLRITTPRL